MGKNKKNNLQTKPEGEQTTIRDIDERIVKRKWKKISLMLVAFLILFIIIGTSIYFIVRSVQPTGYSIPNVEMNADINDVREEILNDENDDERIGLFFYEEDDSTANYLLKDNVNYDEGTDGAGPLGAVMEEYSKESEHENWIWYGIQIPNNNNLTTELFTTKSTIEDEYVFYDDFEYLGGANNSSFVETWYIDNLDAGTKLEEGGENTTVEDQTADNFNLEVVTDNFEEDTRHIKLTTGSETTEDSSSSDDWNVQSGTTMIFEGNKLEVVIDSWTTPSSNDEDSIAQYDEVYSDWLDEIIDKVEL
ncbi:MAG: hypothetical protein TYPL_4640 [Candidatus Tyloplasma litorale]|nr:MAG: hypothetical protein TYPL_4640 [Mycoplasmatales bacterium]